MDLIDVVHKLVGPIEPVGESHTDEQRFENLKVITDLVDTLVWEIDRVSACMGDSRYSMDRAGKFAHEFLADTLGIQE